MQQYELTLIVKPELTEEQADAIIKSLKLDVVSRSSWGKRLLSYPIQEHKEGTYILLIINLLPENVAAMERAIQLHEDVIRHLMVRPEKEI